MKTLMILNDASYGSERTYNGLRLAGSLARQGAALRVFLIGDGVACAKTGQKVPSGYYNTQNTDLAGDHPRFRRTRTEGRRRGVRRGRVPRSGAQGGGGRRASPERRLRQFFATPPSLDWSWCHRCMRGLFSR
jgi:hypothetical protein